MGLTLPTIISGCQTGVDRGAAQVALDMKLSYWGWCPAGRKAEDGRIPDVFPVLETVTDGYWERTEANVRDSDATLIIAPREVLDGGTKKTAQLAERYGRPLMTLTPSTCCGAVPMLLWWLEKHKIGALNVAGPRASKWAEGYATTYHLVGELLHAVLRSACEKIDDDAIPF